MDLRRQAFYLRAMLARPLERAVARTLEDVRTAMKNSLVIPNASVDAVLTGNRLVVNGKLAGVIVSATPTCITVKPARWWQRLAYWIGRRWRRH